MSTPIIKIADIVFGRLQAPDLDVMEKFLTDFGMARSARTANTLYMRGTGPYHHIHVTEKGEPGFLGVAYLAATEDDLHRLAKLEGASAVESIDEPGGGKRVRLREPSNGFRIEVVHGIEMLAPLPATDRAPRWSAEILKTAKAPERFQFGPSRVKRLSHGVFATPHLKETLKWFSDTLGLLCTDAFYRENPDNLVGSFNRLDRGNGEVDHHVLNCYHNPRAGMQHLYEVPTVDDIYIGHNHLKRAGQYEHMRGVGYHPPGGQIYDYWLSPWEQMHEHWLTTQRFTATSATNLVPAPPEADPNSRFANTLMVNRAAA